MKKVWAIICVVGYAAFWTFGFIVLSGIFGDRPVDAVSVVLCIVGFIVGTYGRVKVTAMTPKMHRRRAAARARLEEEYKESLG